MSAESMEWLNRFVLFGFTEKRNRTSWHNDVELRKALGIEDNHYPDAIPYEDVVRRLFNWKALEAPMSFQVANPDYNPDEPEGQDNQAVLTFTDESRKVIYHSDTYSILGQGKDGYTCHDPEEWLLQKVSTLIGDSLAIGSAALLKGGAQAFVQIEMPESITIPNGPTFRPYLGACTSFDGTLATTYKRGVTIWECDNTLAAGLSEAGSKVSVKHTRHSAQRMDLDDTRSALDIMANVVDDFTREVDQLLATTVTDAQWGAFLDSLVPMPKDQTEGRAVTMAETKRGEMSQLWNGDPRVTPWKNTAFGVIQCVNTYEHWQAIVRGNGETDDNDKLALRTMRNYEKTVKGAYDDLDRQTYASLSAVLAA